MNRLGLILLVVMGLITKMDAQNARPNILFLFTDDQRFDTIGALGNNEVSTPNMDRLVEMGTTFTQAHIMGSKSGAVCLPSRAMLMTSLSVHRISSEHGGIAPEVSTLPQVLKENGYTTFGTGKWHNRPGSFAKSFTNGGNIFMGGMSNHLKVPLHDFDESGKYPKKDSRIEDKFSSQLFSEAAIEFIEEYDKENPFFMFVSFSSPHDPRMAPEEYAAKYKTRELSLPRNFKPNHPFDNGEIIIRDENLLPFPRTEEDVKGEIASYYAMVSEVDNRIGQIMDALEKSGQADNTIIVFAGDNGLAVGQHGLIGKQNIYDHSVRVPLVFAGPGIKKGVRSDSYCYLNDIFPTLAKLTDVEMPEGRDGVSLVPVLNKPNTSARESLYFIYKNFQRGVKKGEWKMISYLVKGEKTTQLFNLKKDPLEMNNLADNPKYADKLSELTEEMKMWITKSGDDVDFDADDWNVPVITSWADERRAKGLSLDFKGGH